MPTDLSSNVFTAMLPLEHLRRFDAWTLCLVESSLKSPFRLNFKCNGVDCQEVLCLKNYAVCYSSYSVGHLGGSDAL